MVLQEESGKWVRESESSGENLFKMHLPIPLPKPLRITGEERWKPFAIF